MFNLTGVRFRRIVQRGTHNELIKKEGIYRTFVEGRQEAASWKIA